MRDEWTEVWGKGLKLPDPPGLAPSTVSHLFSRAEGHMNPVC